VSFAPSGRAFAGYTAGAVRSGQAAAAPYRRCAVPGKLPTQPGHRLSMLEHFAMFLISDALAQTAPAAPGQDGGMSMLVLMTLMFVVFYFLMIRPQVKRQKEHKSMVDGLGKGDEVLTAGGLVGKITDLSEQYVTLQVATVDNKAVEISVQKMAVQTLLPKGTIKSL
jgi:preprotein translocase subunit YajC